MTGRTTYVSIADWASGVFICSNTSFKSASKNLLIEICLLTHINTQW